MTWAPPLDPKAVIRQNATDGPQRPHTPFLTQSPQEGREIPPPRRSRPRFPASSPYRGRIGDLGALAAQIECRRVSVDS